MAQMGLNPALNSIKAPTRPRMVIRPESGRIRPFRIFSSVLFPAPLWPIPTTDYHRLFFHFRGSLLWFANTHRPFPGECLA